MQVFVKSLTSKTLSFQVTPQQNVESLKKSIMNTEGINTELMSLIY